ncbi:MAG: enoyl-CoA hydratase/isomerase family protein [Desulfobacteraceae bacterium]|nr:enoyl-CoA hydratase/isomerase family protein [Desulfobacteraceae bacterium]MBC2756164.1 enoyl-CoA hydratase/isomerase family protein [Desulfobacteraceae bacterium]
MKDKKLLEVDFDFFSTRLFDEVVWINFQKNLLIQATSLENRDVLLSYLDKVSACDFIKVIVLRSSLEESGHKEFINFFKVIKSKERNLDLHRLYNVYASLILKINALNKIVVHSTGGDVIPLFLNMSLACDYRIAAENTIFRNSHLDIGVLPIGGGPYFLSRKIGPGKAYELLVLKKEYSAAEGIQYGIVDKIVPLAELETETLKIAHHFGRVPAKTLIGIKRLVNFSTKDLKSYFDFENQEMFRIIHDNEFRSQPGS